jgi:hypothetical protein
MKRFIILSIFTIVLLEQEPFFDPIVSLANSLEHRQLPALRLDRLSTIRTPALVQGNLVSISEVLHHPNDYHQMMIRLRGTVTRLELHLDDTLHFIDFVFFLAEDEQHLLVFGRHDRTKGDIQLTSDRMIEVQGLFWQERFANGHRFENNLEAEDIRFYPPLLPDQARINLPTQSFAGHFQIGS